MSQIDEDMATVLTVAATTRIEFGWIPVKYAVSAARELLAHDRDEAIDVDQVLVPSNSAPLLE